MTCDKLMLCSALQTAYSEAKDSEGKARKERGMTGTNVAAVLLFWPAMLGAWAAEDVEAKIGPSEGSF